jgi:hypothetical protein
MISSEALYSNRKKSNLAFNPNEKLTDRPRMFNREVQPIGSQRAKKCAVLKHY